MKTYTMFVVPWFCGTENATKIQNLGDDLSSALEICRGQSIAEERERLRRLEIEGKEDTAVTPKMIVRLRDDQTGEMIAHYLKGSRC